MPFEQITTCWAVRKKASVGDMRALDLFRCWANGTSFGGSSLVTPLWKVKSATLSFPANLSGVTSQICFNVVYSDSSQTNLYEVVLESVSLKKSQAEVLDKSIQAWFLWVWRIIESTSIIWLWFLEMGWSRSHRGGWLSCLIDLLIDEPPALIWFTHLV